MQARWIQLPFDPVRGTFDDTPLVRALEERPASTVREYFFSFEDRPHLGCFVQWRRGAGRSGEKPSPEEELDEILEELEAQEREGRSFGLEAFEAIEVRRLSPAEVERIERSERLRLERERKRGGANGSRRRAPEDSAARPDDPAVRPEDPAPAVEDSADPAAPEVDEPLDGPAQRAAEVLRAWRNTRRRELDVPAYRVLTNRQLEAVARRRPDTLGALAEIGGFGPATLATHGEAILACLKTAELRSHDADAAQGAPETDGTLAPHAAQSAPDTSTTSTHDSKSMLEPVARS